MQNSTKNLISATPSDSYLNATGKIRYTMTNDYMFNVIFRHTDILAELLCSLLDLERVEITSLEIKMLANGNHTFDRAAQELYKLNGDEMTRYACQMLEEYEFQMRRIDKRIEDAEVANKHLKGENVSLKGENTFLKGQIASLSDENTSLKDELNRLHRELAQSKKH